MVTNTIVAPLYLDKVVSALTVGNPNVTVESVILLDVEKYKDMVGICRLHLHLYILIKGSNFNPFTFEWVDSGCVLSKLIITVKIQKILAEKETGQMG